MCTVDSVQILCLKVNFTFFYHRHAHAIASDGFDLLLTLAYFCYCLQCKFESVPKKRSPSSVHSHTIAPYGFVLFICFIVNCE